MRAARMESWIDKIIFVAPVERILHFVAVVKILAVGNSRLNRSIDVLLAKAFFDEGLFL